MRRDPGTWEVLRFCFSGGGRTSLADGVAILSVWCLTLAIRVFIAFFRLLLPDGNLLLRGVGTLILSAPLLWLYAQAKRLDPRRQPISSRIQGLTGQGRVPLGFF